jgi:hypothetical protein
MYGMAMGLATPKGDTEMVQLLIDLTTTKHNRKIL